MGLSTSSYLPDEKKFNEFTPKKNTSKTQEGGTHQGTLSYELLIIVYKILLAVYMYRLFKEFEPKL